MRKTKIFHVMIKLFFIEQHVISVKTDECTEADSGIS